MARLDKRFFEYNTSKAVTDETHQSLLCLRTAAKVDKPIQERGSERCNTLGAFAGENFGVVAIGYESCLLYVAKTEVSQPDVNPIKSSSRCQPRPSGIVGHSELVSVAQSVFSLSAARLKP